MKIISRELMLIINLSNCAHWHKHYCNGNDCNTSLFQLKEAAIYIERGIPKDDIDEARKVINEMPI